MSCMQVKSIALMSICELQGMQQWLAKTIVALHAKLGLCLLRLHDMVFVRLMGKAFQFFNLQ